MTEIADVLDSEKRCEFCGYEDDDTWLTFRPADTYGPKDSPARQPMHLCGFCRNSYAAQRWLTWGERGVSPGDARELPSLLNVLRDEIRLASSLRSEGE
jgi:hypothetical protein